MGTSLPASSTSPRRDEPEGRPELRKHGGGNRGRSSSRNHPRRPDRRLRHELTEGGGHRHSGRPRGRRGGSGPRAQGGLAGAGLGWAVRPVAGPRRPLAVRRPGGRIHLAPRIQPRIRGPRSRDPRRRVGGGPDPSRDPDVPARLCCCSHSSPSSPTRSSTAPRSTERRYSCRSRTFRWAGRRSSSSIRCSAPRSCSGCWPRSSFRANAGSGTG